jgi:phosphate-selective porin OprO/OprP
MALARGPPDGDGDLGESHDPRPRWRPVLTLALLVAAALATTEAPAAEQGPQQALTAQAQAEAPNALLYVPLKLLSVLDQDFSLGPWTFRGYVQFDGADYTQPAAGPPETDFRRGAIGSGDTLDAQALTDGSYLRKARLGGEGQWGENLSYRAMFDIGGRDEQGEARIAEVWARYSRFAPWVLIVGAYPQLANMEDATSTDANPFLERATAANLARGLGGGDGRLGITVRRATRNWMTAVSLTGPVLHADDETSPRSAVIVRTSRAFYPTADSSLHVGGSLIYTLSPGKSQDGRNPGFGFRLMATPEVRVDDTPLIDTGDIIADHASVLGLEFAARRRNLFLQAEAFHFAWSAPPPTPWAKARATRISSASTPQGSWILTGENRRFDQLARRVLDVPRPSIRWAGGWGAWELAFRYSRMDANSHAGHLGEPPPPGGVRGGDQSHPQPGAELVPVRPHPRDAERHACEGRPPESRQRRRSRAVRSPTADPARRRPDRPVPDHRSRCACATPSRARSDPTRALGMQAPQLGVSTDGGDGAAWRCLTRTDRG